MHSIVPGAGNPKMAVEVPWEHLVGSSGEKKGQKVAWGTVKKDHSLAFH